MFFVDHLISDTSKNAGLAPQKCNVFLGGGCPILSLLLRPFGFSDIHQFGSLGNTSSKALPRYYIVCEALRRRFGEPRPAPNIIGFTAFGNYECGSSKEKQTFHDNNSLNGMFHCNPAETKNSNCHHIIPEGRSSQSVQGRQERCGQGECCQIAWRSTSRFPIV